MLEKLEKWLQKNKSYAQVYQEQVEDMISRGVSRKLTKEEVEEYHGPIHYVSHHPVLKPQSESTPCRIVFNSSAAYSGHILNDYWAKGPQLLNSLVGILLRFREYEIAITGDIKKMCHAVKITELDQHMHNFFVEGYESEN